MQSWPSLFIGANGSMSGMHYDSQYTHFWLYACRLIERMPYIDVHHTLLCSTY